MSREVIVSYQDPDGKPRAWAIGLKKNLEALRKEAKGQLAVYRDKKRLLGDPLATAEFTEVIVEQSEVKE